MIRTGHRPDDLPNRRFWTTREERILIENYAPRSWRRCCALLPGRSRQAIRQRAYQIRKRSAG